MPARRRHRGGNLAGEHAAEGVADERGRSEAQSVEQLAVIDDEVPPFVELMDRIGISGGGPGMARRVDPMGQREAFEKIAVAASTPRAVQKHQRRSISADLDPSLDLALPEPDPALFHRRHVGAAASGFGGRRRGDRLLDPQPLRPPAVLPLVVPDTFEVRKHVTTEQIDVLQA